ncbi:response regulator [Vibrio sp. TRT 17S01]|uniref:hybrid sensor histidine kinase/response regulator n=1 Tax=Vibrio sp. TRT 17S01 TaxID=3418505 RepID=UPI003CF73C7B
MVEDVHFSMKNDELSKLALRRKLTQLLQVYGYSAEEQDTFVLLSGVLLAHLFEHVDELNMGIQLTTHAAIISEYSAGTSAQSFDIPYMDLHCKGEVIQWYIPAKQALKESDVLLIRERFVEKSRDELMLELKSKNDQLAAHQAGLEREIELRTQDLRASEELSRTIIDGAPSSVAIVDSQGTVLLWNKTAQEIYGYEKDEAVGQNLLELLSIEVPPMLKGVLDVPLKIEDQKRVSGGFFEVETSTQTGKKVPIDLGISIFELNGQCQAAMFLRDVTARKVVENELNEARAKAEEAVEVKSMFLANMSHEIRTPMNAIIGMSHLALKTELSPKQHDYISKIHNSATLLLGIINDILDFSKIEAGKLSIETIEFYLDDVFHNVSMVTGQKAFEKGLELLFDIPRGIPKVLFGDPLRLGQIIINLVNNSVKFTESGEITVKVRVIQHIESKVELEIEIADTGIGMTEKQTKNLFQAFTQADGSTTRKYGGTGLGLSICRRLVELMGGNIRVESRYGEGSQFIFNIWLGIDQQVVQKPRIVPETLTDVKALVVDDNEHALLIMEDLLDVLPLAPALANSGQQALDILQQASNQQEPFNLVFMDWNMPVMNGIETTEQIRSKLPAEHQPKVVIVTAYDKEDIADDNELLDLSGYLAKPVGESYLFDMLMNLFSPEKGKAYQPRNKPLSELDHTDFSNVNVLLTEDNEINQQIAIELMEGKGLSVTVANNGQEALNQLQSSIKQPPFDIIFMDLQMPVMDGYEASKQIRSQPEYDDIPLIAMTAHAMVEERDRCLKLGMNDHVSKPIDPEVLFQTIRKWCESKLGTVTLESSANQIAPEKVNADDVKPVVNAPLELKDVTSLDFRNGMLRVAGNENLYKKLLSQLIDKEFNFTDKLEIALEKEDYEFAELTAHTLKGSAGNLGAVRLADMAARLESEFARKATFDDVKPLLTKVNKHIEQLFSELCSVLRRPLPSVDKKDELDTEAISIIHRLNMLLNDLDAYAIEFLDEHYHHLNTLLKSEDFELCCKHINDCDFIAASESLRKAASIYPLDLDRVNGSEYE